MGAIDSSRAAATAGLSQRERANALRDNIVEGWLNGRSMSELGKAYSMSRNAVSRVIEESGTRDAQFSARGLSKRVAAIEWTSEHPGSTVHELADAIGVMPRTAADYVSGTEERKLLVETRDREREYTDQEMLEHIRAVWDSLPESDRHPGSGLSKQRFMNLAAPGAPSGALYDRRFPSWVAACKAAGVPPGRTNRASYYKMYSDDDILDAVETYILETGRTSFKGYAKWAHGQEGIPSGGLTVLRYGTWSAVRRALLERQGLTGV